MKKFSQKFGINLRQITQTRSLDRDSLSESVKILIFET